MGMSGFTAFDNEPLGRSLQATGEAFRQAVESAGNADVGGAMNLDLTNSRLVVDQQLFTYAVSNNNLPPAVLPRFVAAAQTVVDGGVAAFSDGNNVVNGAAVIPWSVLGEHITWRGGATLPIQQALGIVGATDGDDAAQRIRQKFPQSPEWLLTDPFRRRLIIDPLGLPTSHPGILLPGGAVALIRTSTICHLCHLQLHRYLA